MSDVARANMLMTELSQIAGAVAAIDSGRARIWSMVIAGADGRPVGVPTGYMETPLPMMDAIRSQFLTRRGAVLEELLSMGISGLDQLPTTETAQMAHEDPEPKPAKKKKEAAKAHVSR